MDESTGWEGKVRFIIWRAGASLPSRTTGAIFRYIYIYIYGRALHIPT